MPETTITVRGNLTADPELRYTPSGAAVSNPVIASTPRFFDRQANEWKDGETLFVRCTVWRELAENIAESLRKGTAVIAEGKLKARSFQDKDGNNRTSWELDVDDMGASMRGATLDVQKTQKGHAQQGGGFGGGQSQQSGWGAQQPAGDPWGGAAAGGGWDAPGSSEPPF